jgi:hypothetical protein
MRDVVKLLLRPVSVLSLGLSTMGMMDLDPTPVTTHSSRRRTAFGRRCITQGEGSGKPEHHKRGTYDARGAVGGKVIL